MFKLFHNAYVVIGVLVVAIVLQPLAWWVASLGDPNIPFFLLGDLIGSTAQFIGLLWVIAHGLTYTWKGDRPTVKEIPLNIAIVVLLLMLVLLSFGT